jgi:hypothetical protein
MNSIPNTGYDIYVNDSKPQTFIEERRILYPYTGYDIYVNDSKTQTFIEERQILYPIQDMIFM